MAQYLVLDIGGTFIKYAIMDENATFLKQGKVPAVTLSEEKMLASLEELHKEVGDDYEGVAIYMPGRIDTEKGWAYTGGAFTWLHDYPAAEKYGAIFGKPTTIANDGKCAAIAESWSGALADVDSGAVLVLGTGVGGGIVLDADGRPSFTMHATQFGDHGKPQADGACECLLELRGVHNVSNACSAAAVGLMAGLTLAECCAALAKSQPEQGRQRIIRTQAGVTVVDDAYNANPDSMRASLATFAALDVPGRHIAVLGDMGELGAFAKECHERVGAIAGQSNLDCLICVGELAEHIALAATDAGMPFANVRHVSAVDTALVELNSLVKPGDAVLVKASHFMEFDRIVEGLVS